MADTPRALVGDASLPLDLFGRYAVSRTGHEVHRKEPDRELGAALVKDGASGRVDVMAAPLASVSPALGHLMETHPLVADRAIRFFAAVLNFHDPLKAGGIVRIFGLELLEGVFGHGCYPSFFAFSIRQKPKVAAYSPVR